MLSRATRPPPPRGTYGRKFRALLWPNGRFRFACLSKRRPYTSTKNGISKTNSSIDCELLLFYTPPRNLRRRLHPSILNKDKSGTGSETGLPRSRSGLCHTAPEKDCGSRSVGEAKVFCTIKSDSLIRHRHICSLRTAPASLYPRKTSTLSRYGFEMAPDLRPRLISRIFREIG